VREFAGSSICFLMPSRVILALEKTISLKIVLPSLALLIVTVVLSNPYNTHVPAICLKYVYLSFESNVELEDSIKCYTG
jgi:hypothetical protein